MQTAARLACSPRAVSVAVSNKYYNSDTQVTASIHVYETPAMCSVLWDTTGKKTHVSFLHETHKLMDKTK
jgi:hypothetical protein